MCVKKPETRHIGVRCTENEAKKGFDSRNWNFRVIGSDVRVPAILHSIQLKKSPYNSEAKTQYIGYLEVISQESIDVTVISRYNSKFLSAKTPPCSALCRCHRN